MAQIGSLVQFTTPGPNAVKDLNDNLSAIKTAFNGSAVLTDTATTIAVTHTFTALQKVTIGGGFSPVITPLGLQATGLSSQTSGPYGLLLSQVRQTVATTGSTEGLRGYAEATHTSGTVADLIGVVGYAAPVGSGGTTTVARAVKAQVDIQGGTVTGAYAIYATRITNSSGTGSVTNAYGVYISASHDIGTNKYAFYNAGADLSWLGGGLVSAHATAGIGYATGAGGAVTQASSRTTGVTLNTVCGSITLVSAAGSASWQSFTVTNSTVAATDTVRVVQKSGTDLYNISVTNVAAGSFQITYQTTGGTTTEQPVFNFAVLKGVAA